MDSRRLAVTVAAGVAAFGLLTGCGVDDKRDLENISSYDPDYAEVYNNTDGRPNVQLLCIRGVGFSSTTRDFTSLARVPEWDAFCKQFEQHRIDMDQVHKNG